jgi:hypothetical protein
MVSVEVSGIAALNEVVRMEESRSRSARRTFARACSLPCPPTAPRRLFSRMGDHASSTITAEGLAGPPDTAQAIVDRLVAAVISEDILFVLLELSYLRAHAAGAIDTSRTYASVLSWWRAGRAMRGAGADHCASPHRLDTGTHAVGGSSTVVTERPNGIHPQHPPPRGSCPDVWQFPHQRLGTATAPRQHRLARRAQRMGWIRRRTSYVLVTCTTLARQ